MVSVKQAKKILSNEHISDEKVQVLVDHLTVFAKILVEDFQTNKRPPSPNIKNTQNQSHTSFASRRVMGYPCRDFMEGTP